MDILSNIVIDEISRTMLFFVSTQWRKIITVDTVIKKRDLCNKVAGEGQIEILQWAHSNNCPYDSWTCEFATLGGHVDVLHWLRNNNCAMNYTLCSAIAAEKGHVDILKWMQNTTGHPIDSQVCERAAKYGQISVLEWICERDIICGIPKTHLACSRAAEGGQLKALQWLHVKGYPWDFRVCLYAKNRLDDEMLKWISENGCMCSGLYHQ